MREWVFLISLKVRDYRFCGLMGQSAGCLQLECRMSK